MDLCEPWVITSKSLLSRHPRHTSPVSVSHKANLGIQRVRTARQTGRKFICITFLFARRKILNIQNTQNMLTTKCPENRQPWQDPNAKNVTTGEQEPRFGKPACQCSALWLTDFWRTGLGPGRTGSGAWCMEGSSIPVLFSHCQRGSLPVTWAVGDIACFSWHHGGVWLSETGRKAQGPQTTADRNWRSGPPHHCRQKLQELFENLKLKPLSWARSMFQEVCIVPPGSL